MTVDEEKFAPLKPTFDKAKASLAEAGVEVAHFQGAIPNPTTDSITEGARMAEEFRADVVSLGLGGGSSMDSAKAIAVEATHEGSTWDYLFYKKPRTEKTLPIIAVSTTSGTGSQVTQVSVITNPGTRDKSAIYNPIVYPKVAIVDPELMLTVPTKVTASTGFDVFCHSFESALHVNTSASALSRETLQVTGLDPGTHTLEIDGKAVGAYTHTELAAGVELQENAKAPQYAQALEVAMLNLDSAVERGCVLGCSAYAACLGRMRLYKNVGSPGG